MKIQLATKIKQSKIVPTIFIVVYRDKSGGYFCEADMVPEPLNALERDIEVRNLLNEEYRAALKWTNVRYMDVGKPRNHKAVDTWSQDKWLIIDREHNRIVESHRDGRRASHFTKSLNGHAKVADRYYFVETV